VNDQELPESDTSQTESELTSQKVEMAAEATAEVPFNQSVDAAIEDECFEDEELSDDEFEDGEDVDEDELAAIQARSLMEELFEDEDFGEEMSELDVLTLEDAAAYLKVEYGAIRRLLKEQGLPGRKIGDEWRFLRGAIADWLRAPVGNAPPAAAPERPAQAERMEQRPERQDRREFTQRPASQDRISQGGEGGSRYPRPGARYPQQGESRYPQQGEGARYPKQGEGSRYPQEGRPPQRPRYQSEGQQQGGAGQGYQGGGGGNQGGGQGSYPPPRRPRFGNDQNQQAPQGEYRPPRRPPFAGGPGGNVDNQAGGNTSGGGSYGGNRFNGGPKKPKRKALNEQRFKRLDRRKFEGDSGESGGQNLDDGEG